MPVYSYVALERDSTQFGLLQKVHREMLQTERRDSCGALHDFVEFLPSLVSAQQHTQEEREGGSGGAE